MRGEVRRKDDLKKNLSRPIRVIKVTESKYFDKDSGWSARNRLYTGLGGSGTYTGSASQNTWLIKKMKEAGYQKGGLVGGLINRAGEDGILLARRGEYVLTERQFALANEMVSRLTSHDSQPTGDITMNISLPNVQNGEDFVNFLKSKKAQNIIQSYTTDLAVGKNSLSKHKYK